MLTRAQKAYLPLKRLIDIFGSTLGIILLSWLMIIAAIITKCTSKGPILFKQERLGRHEKVFTLYKFRSMKVEANAHLSPIEISEEERKDMTTKWGRFMRKTSIDELPQLFNILLGHMSFIGPRPGQTKEGEPELYAARTATNPTAYEVKPGLSGYSQITYHRNPDVNLKATGDSYYVSHLSLWMDIKLFFLSFLVLFGYQKGK